LLMLSYSSCRKKWKKQSAFIYGIVSDVADNSPLSGVIVTLTHIAVFPSTSKIFLLNISKL